MNDEELLRLVFVIIFVIGLPLSIAIMIANYRKQCRLMHLHHTERMTAIERGMEVRPQPWEVVDGRSDRRRTPSLLTGLMWFLVGIAILISMKSFADEEALLGLIPVGIGLAYLIYYFVEGRKLEARLLETNLRSTSVRTNVGVEQRK